MITIPLMGGLGNQLFQIFATIAYAIEHGHSFLFQYTDILNVGKMRVTYWNNFLSNLVVFTTKSRISKFSNSDLEAFPLMREQGFNYTKINAVPPNISISLHGYYQSYKYFEEYQRKIYEMILLKNQQNAIRTKYGHYLEGAITISMHFRLGDYKDKQHFHPIMPKIYYENALKHILETKYEPHSNVRILYFCEAEDNEFVAKTMESILSLFSDYHHLQIQKVEDGIEDWQQLLLMSCCDNNIIANSSFSWWGAYLNQTIDKCVCYPCKWFGPSMANTYVGDMFPIYWHKIVF